MTAVALTVATLLALAAVGLAAAAVYTMLGHGRTGPAPDGRTVLARAGSYAALAIALACAVAFAPAGVALLVAIIGLVALWEWARLADLPGHHRLMLAASHLAVVLAVHLHGASAVDWLIGGLVLVGALWPVVRADPTRGMRDLGFAATGFIFITVMLVHAVALVHDFGAAGAVVFAALAVACACSDVGAFLTGRRYGRTALAPTVSPAKTRAGLSGNFLGAAVALALLGPSLALALAEQSITGWYGVLLVPIVALGSVWGDLFESAAKREAGVKDAASWLPGFGGMLDRVDSLLLTLPLAYWSLRLLQLLVAG